MDIKEARDTLLETVNGIDKDKLSLAELKNYAEILKIISEIQVKNYEEYLSNIMSGFCCGKATTISDLKGGAENGLQTNL